MGQSHASSSGRARTALALTSAAFVAIAVGAAPRASGAGDMPGTRATPTTTGEGEPAGPITAPVDPAHADVNAARSAALAAHAHDHAAASSPSGATDQKTGTVAAAALDPAVFGQWQTLSYKLPLRAVHATLLKTGKFLLVAGSGNVANDHVIANFKAYLWDPATNSLTSIPVPYDAFCSGHLVDANGDVIVLGGTLKYRTSSNPWMGQDKMYKFVVATSSWMAMPSMKQGRWYPTAVVDGQNRVLAFSGQDATGATPSAPERFDPVTRKWSALAATTLPLYPSLHLLKDGRLAYTGAYYRWTWNGIKPQVFDPVTGARVTIQDPNALVDSAHRNAAMSALVGSADNQLAWVAGGGFPAVRSTYFIDLNASAPKVVAGPPLAAAKGYVSIADLPDLTALETGGGTGTDSPVFEASILNPGTRTLVPVAPPAVPRTYHSSAITMPDGRVVTFGGDPSGDANFELRVEIYSPPYLFKGARPVVASAPTEVSYGGSYNVGLSGAGPFSAVIMRPGSATHSMDANQRVLKLSSTAATGGIRVTLPTNRNLAPPGWYLLFVNDGAGRPTIGRWVHLT